MAGVDDYSITAASNTTLGGIGVSNSTLPNQVDDLIRQLMADIRRALNDIGAKAVSGGAADAQTLTTETVYTAYADGTILGFIAGFTNTGAATLNVDAVGAKAIRKGADAALAAGDITAGMVCIVVYDASANGAAGAWMLANPYTGTTAYQAAAATLTAIAALAVTDGNIIVGNGSTWVAENGATARTSLGVGSGDSPQLTAVELGHASDTTVAREAAGQITVEGNRVYSALAGQWDALTEKTSLADADLILIEDSAASGAKKKVQKSNLASASSIVFSSMTADFTTSSGTEADVTGLSFAIGANETWEFVVNGIFSAGASTTGAVDVTGPASPTTVSLSLASFMDGGGNAVVNTAAAFGTNMDADSVGSAAGGAFCLSGRIVNGVNAGTVQVRGLRSAGGGSVTIYRTSLIAEKQ